CYSNLPISFQTTDTYPQSMRWWDMYSNVVRYAPSFSGLNREHSMPKSWWKVGSDVEYTPAYVDLNHLYPADGPANQAKSNYPLGTVNMAGTVTFNNNVSIVGVPVSGQGGGAKYVYEPADEYKGDFARTYFYMVTCYQNLQWNSSYLWMLQRNTYPTLTSWAVDLLLAWHRQDPVSQKEVERNEAVWGYQNNRNPFIDFPDLAEYIWGRHVGEPFQTGLGGTTGDPELTAPVAGTTLDFGEVAVGSTATALLYFKGTALSSPLSISLGGTDRAMFSIPDKSIAQGLVNASAGYYMQVSYTPTAVGEHNARILIYDGGLPGTGIYVYFKGEALDVPHLSTLTAHEPSAITADRYTASW
ncbi:MAG: endonuclease, partial [Duncaniella sp.]|nr:endonuclease [Duncaniella sp.]